MSSSADLTSSEAPRAHEPREAGRHAREPGRRDRGAGSIAVREAIDDRLLVATLVPLFGLGIPHATGLFGPLGPGDAAWWWGHPWFVAGAGAIYGANRALLFAGRAHADWFSRPVARIVLLATGIVFGTVPSTWLVLHGWAAASGVPLGDALRTVMLVNVVCVLFVTWLYETLFLIRERVDDHVRLERIEAARVRAELDALRAQVDPHFLFNALNTLAALIDVRPGEARDFVDHLARVYRALLDTRGRALVPLAEELELARAYAALLRVRFGDSVRIDVLAPPDAGAWLVPPGAAQVLLENAVRHNAIDPAAPLAVAVDATGGVLEVAHARRPRPAAPGAGTGLANLDARSVAATGRPIVVDAADPFRVAVPMVPAG